MHHEDRHLVSNMLGVPDMRIEVGSTRRLAPLDTLLVASDGLSDNLHTEEIIECIRTGPLADVARQLVRDAHRRMEGPTEDEPSKPDDLTFVGFRRGR
jgi:serine/threonine protein phosphatase PrpC